MFVDFLQTTGKFRQLQKDLQHLVVSLRGLRLVDVAHRQPDRGSFHSLEEGIADKGEEDGAADGIALAAGVDIMVEDGCCRIDGGPVEEGTLRIVLHLDHHPASVLEAAMDVETGVPHLSDGDGDVARKIVQTLDVVVREDSIEKFEQDVLVRLVSQKILESPVGSGVDETLVLVIDEIAVLACHSLE